MLRSEAEVSPPTIVALYQEMADLTELECRTVCRPAQSCCGAEYCNEAIRYAAERHGVTLQRTGHPTLPLMGPHGCTAAPHLRPFCTMHVCEINGLGFKRDDPDGAWTDRYFRLRERIDEAEFDADRCTT